MRLNIDINAIHVNYSLLVVPKFLSSPCLDIAIGVARGGGEGFETPYQEMNTNAIHANYSLLVIHFH